MKKMNDYTENGVNKQSVSFRALYNQQCGRYI